MRCNQCEKLNPPRNLFCQHCGAGLVMYPPKIAKNYISPDARCPTCGSNNIQRISPGGKATKIVAFGVFGLGDVHKIFRCLNCGYKW